MKFSLIVPTKGRVKELERLFRSLDMQTFTDFEVIISDQNGDDRLVEIIRNFSRKHRILHVRSNQGASRARNAGISHAQGEIVTFPDDDCAYPPEVLKKVAHFFDQHPQYAFLTGRSYTDDGQDAIARHEIKASSIIRNRIHHLCIEFVFFIRKSALADLRFDEAMGVGCPTPWQADEGPDLALRLEDQGAHGFYDPQIAIWHPEISAIHTQHNFDRSYRYACGTGYFLRKHHFSARHFCYYLARTLLGVVASLMLLRANKARFYVERLRGLWRGWNCDREQPR